jgi:hypothetical protein
LKFSLCVVQLILALALASKASADDVVVKRFDRGSDQNSVGIIEASEDTEIDGPQALTTGEGGEVYLLDQVNERIVGFDPKRSAEEPRVLQLPGELRPTDLIVRKSDILVWDGSIHSLQPASGDVATSYRGLEEVHTRAAEDQTVVSAFAQMGSQVPGDSSELLDENTRAAASAKPPSRARQHVATRGAGSVVVDVIPGAGDSSAVIEVRREGETGGAPIARLSIKVRDRLGAVQFLEVDNGGRMFVFAEDIPATGASASAFVVRYSPTGMLEGIYDLPLSNVPLSRRFVTVSGDGDVYFLRTQSGSVEVLGMGFRALPKGKVIGIAGSGSVPSAAGGLALSNEPITAVRPLTRQRVIETAFAFEGVQWLVTPTAYGRDPDTVCTGFAGRIRRPFYLHGKAGQMVRGIPYCWGCHGSLPQILSNIQHNALAGNICTHNAPRSDATGVDCSAFVSAAWGLATHFTTAAIPAIAQPVSNPWDLRPGDALDKPGSHVMLFLRFTGDRMAEVMESSPGACNGRVCRNIYPLASLLARGYHPVRFRALANDTSAVAQVAAPDNSQLSKKEKSRPNTKRAHRN